MQNLTLKQSCSLSCFGNYCPRCSFCSRRSQFSMARTVYNSADIAWIIVATALVFLMTPGLAFFYGGMVHRKNVISTMIKSVVAAGVVSVLWVVVGFSLCFGESVNGFIGDPTTFLFFKGCSFRCSMEPGTNNSSNTIFAVFQLMFAIITPGLVVGAVAERIRFTSYILFIALIQLTGICSNSTLDLAS